MRLEPRSAVVVALVAASLGFGAGTAWNAQNAGATGADVNTPILKSINAKLSSIHSSLGRNDDSGIWNEAEDAKDLLRAIERNTRR